MISSTTQIAILMATFNGERYLPEQIDSILAQSCQDWHLFIHDDGSTDGTLCMLKDYAGKHPDRITLLDYPSQGGACRNFMSMLQRVDAPYYMFSDQDDVWHPDKIAQSMEAMQLVELQHPGKPVVVHTDMLIVDDTMHQLHHSFFQYSNIHPESIVSYSDYVQNIVTGSTMLFNREAKTVSLSRPYTLATMHDSWITLRTVASGGVRHTIYRPLISYRQHSANVLGAEDGHRFTLVYRLTHLRQMLLLNYRHYLMLRAAGPISIVTFLKNKYKFHKQYSQK